MKMIIDKKDYWWWSKGKGWVPVKQMNDRHLENALKSLERHGKSYTKGYYVLLQEKENRGNDPRREITTC